MNDAPRAWLTRSGRSGERDAWALAQGVTPGGFSKVPDLSGCQSLDDVRALVGTAYPDSSPNAVGNFAAQLWALAGRMQIGDYVVLPRKTTSQLAIGRITGQYEYRSGDPEPDRRHVRPVEWLRTDVPRPAVKQDLLYSLGAFSTYCEVSRNDAAARIAAIAQSGADPGSKVAASSPIPSPQQSLEAPEEEAAPDLEEYAQVRIAAIVREAFKGHAMQDLVADILRAQGFTCDVVPAGPDGGIDIRAGKGPLGLDEPRLVVQVKSEQGTVGDPAVKQLLFSVKDSAPAQGLLVAWGGLTPAALKTAEANYFNLRVWTESDLIEQLTTHYHQLSEEIRKKIPLKQIWITVEEQA